MLNIGQNGDQNRIQNEKWNEKAMQKDNAESGCSERRPKTCKGKEKEVMGRKSEAGGNFGPRRTEWEEAYLPLKGGTVHLGTSPPERTHVCTFRKTCRHMSARLAKTDRKVKNPAARGFSELWVPFGYLEI